MSDVNDNNGGAKLYPNQSGPNGSANPIAKFLPIIIGVVILAAILAFANSYRNRAADDAGQNRIVAPPTTRPGGDAMGGGATGASGAATPTGGTGAGGATSGTSNPPGPAGARQGGQ